MNAYFFSK